MDASVEKQFEELRATHKVRIVSEEEDGTGINNLPGGVYGFTYSPASDNFPLFKKRVLRSYEAHKLGDGTAILVGFITEGESLQMSAGRESVTIHLFPEPQAGATQLTTVPMTRVTSHKEHSQRGDTGLELQIGPVN
jgi:hypothetical protein